MSITKRIIICRILLHHHWKTHNIKRQTNGMPVVGYYHGIKFLKRTKKMLVGQNHGIKFLNLRKKIYKQIMKKIINMVNLPIKKIVVKFRPFSGKIRNAACSTSFCWFVLFLVLFYLKINWKKSIYLNYLVKLLF